MIKVTKLNGELFYVNPYEIEFIEETPDTVISLKSGKKVLVSEKAQIVIHRMIEFYRLANVMPKLAPESVADVGQETDSDELDKG
jgi:flagellar protein FlbD